MSEIKKTRELNETKQEQEKNNHEPYKCNQCGDRVSYTFILPFIKASGLCPNCFNEDVEE